VREKIRKKKTARRVCYGRGEEFVFKKAGMVLGPKNKTRGNGRGLGFRTMGIFWRLGGTNSRPVVCERQSLHCHRNKDKKNF